MPVYSTRSIFRPLALFILGVSLAGSGPIQSEESSKNEILYRLPNNTYPITYDIHLTTAVDTGDTEFTGEVIIVLRAINEFSEIVLHAKQLDIVSVSLSSAYEDPVNYDVEFSYDEVTEFLTVAPKTPLRVDNYQLHIVYKGRLRTDSAGFYLSTYTDASGNIKYLAATQFQPSNARHAFPCYDEPAKKAIFRISITHGNSYTVVSNMPPVDEPIENGDGTATTSFRLSKLMSTYLIAFLVSDLSSSGIEARIPHRVFSRIGTENEQVYALDTSVRTLEFLEDYFDVSYKLPKIDNAAIPDFAAGAMENWGLITYREEALLYNEKDSTTNTQISVATTIAHEFVHQWFGNLISPQWWTYTWLNEGFANLFTYITVNELFPEFDIWQLQVVSRQRSLESDGKENPRAMTHYVETPKEIVGVFDDVSYSKAASVLSMIRHVMTADTFQRAIHDYIIKMEYGVAEEDDLFESLEKVIKEENILGSESDVVAMLKSWTNQGGFPVITVKREYEKGTFEIKQEPFDGTDNPPSTDERSWWIPFNFVSAKDPHFNETNMFDFLDVGEEKKEVIPPAKIQWESGDWIVLNKRATAYYRVNYDDNNWKLLTLALVNSPNVFHLDNRAQLLDDAFALSQSSRLDIERFLDLSVYLKNESDYAPWQAANSYMSTLNKYLSSDSDYDLFQYYIGKIVENFYQLVGVTEGQNDAHLRKLTRPVIINWACQANYGDCLEVTNSRLRNYIQAGRSVEPNLKTTIFCNGLKRGGQIEFTFMLSVLMNSKDQAYRRQLMSTVMGCVEDISLIERYLQTSIQYDDTVNYKEQERLYVVPGVANKGPKQLEAAIDFLYRNHAKYSLLTSDWSQNNPLLLAIRSIANWVVTTSQQEHFERLLDALTIYEQLSPDDFDEVRATVQSNLDWTDKFRDDVIQWLKNFKGDDGGGIDGSGDGGEGDGAAAVTVSTTVIVLLSVASVRFLL